MRPDTTLVLGDFEFSRFEIPEQIPFGGEQRLNVHELVGGVRVVQAMGSSPKALEWSGYFVGIDALERAFDLDTIRKAGKQRLLTWAGLRYGVVVRSLVCEYKRMNRIPYHIQCEVVQDLTGADSVQGYIAELKQLIAEDQATANSLVSQVGDGPLSSLMGGLNTAIGAVSDFAKASQATLNSVLQPIAAVRQQVNILMQSANGVIQNVTTLGGILPGNPIAQQANKLTSQINAVNQSGALFNLDRVLGRMQTNIGTIGR